MSDQEVTDDEPQPDRADTLEEALVIIRRRDEEENPRRRFIDTATIRESTRMAIVADHSAFIDEHTGEIHHHAIRIYTVPKIAKSRGGGWSLRVPSVIWIEDSKTDEIKTLRDFLTVVRNEIPEEEGKYLVLGLDGDDGHAEALQKLIDLAPSAGKAEALAKSIESVSGDPEALERLATFAANNPQATQVATAALNISKYRTALQELKRLMDENALEGQFQRHLEDNYWLFGTDYCENLSSRRLTRDEIQDFIVRRTTDNYIEIVEIKTPLRGQPLFGFDTSHNSHYASAPLSKVVGQVINYIQKIDRRRNDLIAEDGLDVNKIRARIVIGRDGDAGQQEALRNYNGHLHRIEVMTFDHLYKIGENIVGHLESVINMAAQGNLQGVELAVAAVVDDFDDVPF